MIRNLLEYSTLTVAVLLSGAALGQTQVPNTFQSGSPALASEVNENFDVLAQAVQVLESTVPVPGPVGPQGPQGAQGPAGLQGSQGPAGQDAVVDPALVQTRVSGTCAVGSFVSAIAEDGTVACDSGSDANDNTRYGATALSSNTTGTNNAAFGVEALFANTDGFTNAAFGTYALSSNTTGHRNVAVGSQSLRANTVGHRNIAVGMGALGANTEGSYNTAVGSGGTLSDNVTGDYNTAIGALALHLNTGGQNTATGAESLYSNTTGILNTANGIYALRGNTEGVNNTASGSEALALNTTGSGNTGIGANALLNNVIGDDNLAMGNYSGQFITGSRNIAIANNGVAGESNTIRVGNANHVRTFVSGIRGIQTGVADAVTVVIDSNGQLGTISSSRRYKQEINDMGEASGRLLDLNPVTFRYREARQDGDVPLEYGLIAEEVAEVFPDLVVFNSEGQPETVKYRLLSSLLLNELQKQHQQLGGQMAEISELKGQLTELSEIVSEMAGRVGHISE